MSKLPIGIQTFRQIREEGYYYVDKTFYARRLVEDAGKHYFLSRPRRFGKSLFVDTLKELFEGSERLFRGLAIHDGWDWSQRHPVVRLDFSGGTFKQPGELHASAMRQLIAAQQQATPGPLARLMDVLRGRSPAPFEDDTLSGRFATLLETLHRRSRRRVVVLVDEYDKPILDAMDDPEIAEANRDDLRGLYGTLKACDAHVELTFITGVSKFSKVSLFSI
ncbi:MAG: AAA family ATPase [Spirochaetaceae bacterium]|nr:AAA family ATPase [Spirochaetaceae bacterium]